MTDQPYIRQELAATARGELDPGHEVENWLEDGLELLEATGDATGAARSYDLLAAWGRLQRTDPDLLAVFDERGIHAQLEAFIHENADSLVGDALLLPNVAAWQEQAELLDSACEWADEQQHVGLAREVLLDLDDADLVAAAAQMLGRPDAELTGLLEAANDWVCRHADAFLPIGPLVQAIGMTFRSDLAPPLQRTAGKFVAILDALVGFERDLRAENIHELNTGERDALQSVTDAMLDQPDLSLAEAVERWEAERMAGRPLRLEDFLPAETGRQFTAAAVSAVSMSPVFDLIRRLMPAFDRTLRWRSPDGRLLARLTIPGKVRSMEGAEVLLRLLSVEGRPITDQAGKRVYFCGVAGELDGQGVARFPLGELAAHRQRELTLAVGEPDQLWQFDPASSGRSRG